jgi:hypothetical protein
VRQYRALSGADVRRVSFVLLVHEWDLRHPGLLDGRGLLGRILLQRNVCRLAGQVPTGVLLVLSYAVSLKTSGSRGEPKGSSRAGDARIPPRWVVVGSVDPF